MTIPFKLPALFTFAVGAFLLTSCELPPREAWSIIQRDGLLTYYSRDYNPAVVPTRYLAPRHGTPFRLSSYAARVPYRPTAENRYLATDSRIPYRQKVSPRRVAPRSSPKPLVVETDAPQVAIEPAPVKKNTPSVTPPIATPRSTDAIPYGAAVPGRPGMVTSPFAQQQQLVDVTGMASGEVVKDPYSGKLFRVPPTQQAAAEKTEIPAPEAPKEEPKP